MKKCPLFLFMVFIFLKSNSFSQVVKVDLPDGIPAIRETVTINNIIFGHSSKGLKWCVSFDKGKKWELYEPIGIEKIQKITAGDFPERLYGIDSVGGIFSSSDSGKLWEALGINTHFTRVRSMLVFRNYLLIGSWANDEIPFPLIVINLSTGKTVEMKYKIPPKSSVLSMAIAGGRVILGTNGGFYFEDRPDELSQALVESQGNNNPVHIGENWFFPAKYGNFQGSYDKYLRVNEFKNLKIWDIKSQENGTRNYAATDNGLYYSDHDGLQWGPRYANDDYDKALDGLDDDIWGSDLRTNVWDLVARGYIENILPTRNFLILGSPYNLAFAKEPIGKLESWKPFTLPKDIQELEFDYFMLVDQKSLLLSSSTQGTFLLTDIEKYLSSLK